MKLDGKCALITGAGSGIGQALAVEAARQGIRLMLTGRRLSALEETRVLMTQDADVSLVAADITEANGREALRGAVQERFARLDLLFNNAGVQSVGPFRDATQAQLSAMLETNLLAPMLLTQSLLDLLKAAAPSRVVNIGSMFGLIGSPMFAGYSTSKFGLRGFSDALRRELKSDGISVSYAAPRATRTPAQARSADQVAHMKMTVDEPQTVARHILSGVAGGARTIYPRGPERLFVILQGLVPGLIDRALAR